jgi:CheY-like chemotaxis protein
MAYLPSLIDATLRFPCNEPPEPPKPPARSINTSPKSALLVEDDESLLSSFRVWLDKEGYAVRTASSTEEAFRLYRDCRPFNVVLINYYVPQRKGANIDCLAPQIYGIQLAMAILNINPSQGMILAALDYRNAGEVPRPPEMMHIPVLISIVQLRSLLEKVEVDRAIRALTSTELLRLQKFSKFRIRGLGRAAGGRDWEDLLAEALLRTLIGAEDTQSGRHWNKKVSFAHHLTWAISSIADVWKRQFKEKNIYLVSELESHDAHEQQRSPLDKVASRQVSADQRLIEEDEGNRVLTRFEDDPEAKDVLQGLMDGQQKKQIMLRCGLDEKTYAAVVKRIRVKLLRMRNNGTRGEKHGK